MLVRTVHGYRRLFGVPDEIPDVTRVSGMVRGRILIYGMRVNGVRNCSREHREGIGEPKGVSGATVKVTGPMGHKWGDTTAHTGAVRPP